LLVFFPDLVLVAGLGAAFFVEPKKECRVPLGTIAPIVRFFDAMSAQDGLGTTEQAILYNGTALHQSAATIDPSILQASASSSTDFKPSPAPRYFLGISLPGNIPSLSHRGRNVERPMLASAR
jgi:hypothetical protein